MSCNGCGGAYTPQIEYREGRTMQDLYNTGNYTIVRYNGHVHTATVGSPTGIIAKDGLRNYGRAKAGDYLLVHVADISHSPTLFTLIDKNTEMYKMALAKFGIEETIKNEKSEPTKKEKVSKAQSSEEAVTEPVEQKEQVEPTPVDTNEGLVLTKENALPLKAFQEKYGFTHHLQVLAKVKSGELYSYKDDDTTYIYHVEG